MLPGIPPVRGRIPAVHNDRTKGNFASIFYDTIPNLIIIGQRIGERLETTQFIQ